jgi:hypothetical protein
MRYTHQSQQELLLVKMSGSECSNMRFTHQSQQELLVVKLSED